MLMLTLMLEFGWGESCESGGGGGAGPCVPFPSLAFSAAAFFSAAFFSAAFLFSASFFSAASRFAFCLSSAFRHSASTRFRSVSVRSKPGTPLFMLERNANP